MFLAIAERICSCLRTALDNGRVALDNRRVSLDNGRSAEAGGRHYIAGSARKPWPCDGRSIDDGVRMRASLSLACDCRSH